MAGTPHPDERRRLRAAIEAAYPWTADPEIGPRSVPAGECDRCGDEARLVATCGPVRWSSLGRRCAAEVGTDAWCDGHRADGEGYLAWLDALPPEADDVARLYWVATGEVALDPELLSRVPLSAAGPSGPPEVGPPT